MTLDLKLLLVQLSTVRVLKKYVQPFHKMKLYYVQSLLHVCFDPQELHADIPSQFLPEMLGVMLRTLHSHVDSVSLEDVTHGLRACFKVLSKIQMPVAYMDIETGAQTEQMEMQTPEEEGKTSQVRSFIVYSVVSLNTFCKFIVALHKNDTFVGS